MFCGRNLMIDRIKLFCCTGGVGLLPKAPGTWGSLFPLIILLALGHFGASPLVNIISLLGIVVLSSLVTITLAPWYTNYFGKQDPSQVVCDEWAGQSIALLGMAWLVPETHVSPETWIGLAIVSFVLFRLFDIWKPAFIGIAEKLSGGWGVLFDDILAGIAAGILVFITAVILS
jgi:phosphatidylglycerophosphatase A